MLTKSNALKVQILDRLKIRIQALRQDLSFFELLSTGGQCNPAFRQHHFQKNISGSVEQLLSSLCMQDFQATLHLKCGNAIASHRCTAHTHCPLRLNVWYLLEDVDSICESSTGICSYEFEPGDMSKQCSQCLSVG